MLQMHQIPTIKKAEAWLLASVLALAAFAVFGPHLAQHAHQHDFADRRVWAGLPFAMDVLSNLPFALWGAAGLLALGKARQWLGKGNSLRIQALLAALFFIGLVITAAASSWYHLQPQNAGLVIDRLGMTVAFAGLLGLAAAGRISGRAGVVLAATVLLMGPLSLQTWLVSGSILPWAVLQFGGMAMVVGLAWRKPLPQALPVSWLAVIALYAVAKLLELADHQVFELTNQFVSGHSLKHVVASFAAWPVLAAVVQHGALGAAVCNGHQSQQQVRQTRQLRSKSGSDLPVHPQPAPQLFAQKPHRS